MYKNINLIKIHINKILYYHFIYSKKKFFNNFILTLIKKKKFIIFKRKKLNLKIQKFYIFKLYLDSIYF